jgi:hypothetical protein
MTIDEFLKTAEKAKVEYFFAGVDRVITEKKSFFKSILKHKESGRLRFVITNQFFTFKVIGTFYFEGEPFFCDECMEKHRRIVVKIDEVTDMSGSIIANMN